MKKVGTKSKTKLYIIIEAVLIAIVIGMSIFFGLALNGRRVDFDQNITSEDGTELNHTFDAKADEDFVVRFADLECNEDCSNVSSVKIGDRTLEAGKDYEVERGSVIIKIFKKTMQTITNGKHDIVVKIEQNGKTVTVGVKITITNSVTTNEQQEQNTESENNNEPSQNDSAPQPAPAPEPTPAPEPEVPKTCSDLHNCDYNLNNHYVIRVYTVNFYQKTDKCNDTTCTGERDENGNFYHDVLPVAETKRFVDIELFNGTGCGADGTNAGSYIAGPTSEEWLRILKGPYGSTVIDGLSHANNYAVSHNYAMWPWGGAGCQPTTWTWEGAVSSGLALDEAKCAAWGLSCGRW